MCICYIYKEKTIKNMFDNFISFIKIIFWRIYTEFIDYINKKMIKNKT